MDSYHEKKVVEQAVGKRGREAENKQRKRYKNEGVRRGCYKALKRPPADYSQSRIIFKQIDI